MVTQTLKSIKAVMMGTLGFNGTGKPRQKQNWGQDTTGVVAEYK
jgi:hypothetical protein